MAVHQLPWKCRCLNEGCARPHAHCSGSSPAYHVFALNGGAGSLTDLARLCWCKRHPPWQTYGVETLYNQLIERQYCIAVFIRPTWHLVRNQRKAEPGCPVASFLAAANNHTMHAPILIMQSVDLQMHHMMYHPFHTYPLPIFCVWAQPGPRGLDLPKL